MVVESTILLIDKQFIQHFIQHLFNPDLHPLHSPLQTINHHPPSPCCQVSLPYFPHLLYTTHPLLAAQYPPHTFKSSPTLSLLPSMVVAVSSMRTRARLPGLQSSFSSWPMMTARASIRICVSIPWSLFCLSPTGNGPEKKMSQCKFFSLKVSVIVSCFQL